MKIEKIIVNIKDNFYTFLGTRTFYKFVADNEKELNVYLPAYAYSDLDQYEKYGIVSEQYKNAVYEKTKNDFPNSVMEIIKKDADNTQILLEINSLYENYKDFSLILDDIKEEFENLCNS